jgi:putative solute:sodium symporter small subunit
MSGKDAPTIVEADENSVGEKDRWRVLLPGVWGDNAIFFAHFCAWLLALSFIEEAGHQLKLVLFPAWLLSFLALYARRTASYPTKAAANSVYLNFPVRSVPYAMAFWVLTALSVPWVEAIVMRKCPVPRFGTGTSVFVSVDLFSSMTVSHAFVYLLSTATYPLLEEFFARGWVFGSLRKRGINRAVMISAAIFSIIHLSLYPSLLTMYFCFGVALGYAVITTGSIWTAVGMHFVWNLTANSLDNASTSVLVGRFLGFAGADCRYSWLYLGLVAAATAGLMHLVLTRRIGERPTSELDD